jgi:hemerythrin-like metal-binding protein
MSNPPQPYFHIEEKYLVGVEVLDRQHQEIVTLVGELYESIIAKEPRDVHLELLTRFVKLAKTHFATEEQVLCTHRYPGYLRHKAAHEGLVRNLMDYRERIVRRERKLSVEYVDLMKLWLLDHFAVFDLEYAKFLALEKHPGEKASKEGAAAHP